MSFDPSSKKHQSMHDLLDELSVPNPEEDSFYSRGSTVTEVAISSALQALRNYKEQVRKAADSIIKLSGH